MLGLGKDVVALGTMRNVEAGAKIFGGCKDLDWDSDRDDAGGIGTTSYQ